MKILKFEFEDLSEGWKLNETQFNDSFTLLVGASGVGKTLILKSLWAMRIIAKGNSYTGANWNIEFVSNNNDRYRWAGAFQNQGIGGRRRREIKEEKIKEENCTKIDWENLFHNNKLIIERNQNGIRFLDEKTPKLSPLESALSLLKEEDCVKPAYDGFSAIDIADHTDSSDMFISPVASLSYVENEQKVQSIQSLEDIQKVHLPLVSKLFLLEKCDSREFSNLQDRFTSIFPQVQTIRSAPLENFDEEYYPSFLRDLLVFQIKEHGVDHWIEPSRISSGMLRVINQLCDLYLNPEGTIFLVDEFENSLGINCIREITADIISPNRCFQFIVTSHHPYIINNIDVRYWKLVTRNGGVIKTHSLSDLGCHFGKSHHDTFMQLLQLKEYQTGQEQSE